MRTSRWCAVWAGVGVWAVLAGGIAVPSSGRAEGLNSIVVPVNARVQDSTVEPQAETKLLHLLNSVRGAAGRPPLHMDASLRFAAREHSLDMARNGYIGHGTPGGQSVLDRLARVVRRGYVGENVTIARTVEEAHDAFVASLGHRENILNPAFRRVGIGVSDAGSMGVIVTEDFAE